MLLTAVDQRHLADASLTTNDVVVAVAIDPPRMMDTVLRILPQTTNVVVVLGNSPLEQFWLQEVDSVAHWGGSMAGDFIWSLTYTSLGTGWTEGRAVWNKGYQGVLTQTRDVEAHLPFALRGMDFDNGGEWLHWQLVRFLQQRAPPVKLTRSRPYHQDDNAHVEQKNWMWSRQLLGYGRLENPATVRLINELYRDVWGPLHNFFLPSTKLVEKRREGSRIVRRHDAPRTAYQRLVASGELNRKVAARLRDQFAAPDPLALARSVNQRLKKS